MHTFGLGDLRNERGIRVSSYHPQSEYSVMPMKTRTRVVASGLVLLVLGPMTQSCLRAEWYHHKLKPGMTVAEVFNAVDGWMMCNGHSRRPANDPYSLFWATSVSDGTYTIHSSGDEGERRINSREELIQSVQQQMSDGHTWHVGFIWFGHPRSSFLISFDVHGRVERVSDIAGND